MRELGIGLIGTGFMGRAHALAFNNARAVFELPVHLKLAALADADTERAQRCASAWGLPRPMVTGKRWSTIPRSTS